MNVFDVCCGMVDWLIMMVEEIGFEGYVMGFDFSENMLKVGCEKVKEVDLYNVEFIYGNVMELFFLDNSFDYVMIGFGFRNVLDYM